MVAAEAFTALTGSGLVWRDAVRRMLDGFANITRHDAPALRNECRDVLVGRSLLAERFGWAQACCVQCWPDGSQ